MKLTALACFGLPGGVEWVVILVVALLIFGRRLPDVARSVGKSIVEFKKGLRDVKGEIDVQSRLEPPLQQSLEEKTSSTTPSSSSPPTSESTAKAAPSTAVPEATPKPGSPPSD